MKAARISIKAVRFFMRNVRTRMPFKYGVATLTSVPILHVRLEGELDDRQAQGWAADILPPKWFDKDSEKEYEDNVDDLIAVAAEYAHKKSRKNKFAAAAIPMPKPKPKPKVEKPQPLSPA